MACLVSGGKDSVLALWVALHQYNVVAIISVQSTCEESLLFHLPNSKYVYLVADMLNIPHKEIVIETCELSDEINCLSDAFSELNIDAIVTGGIRSEFQRYKFNKAAYLAGIRCFSPLWRLAPKKLMNELIDNKFHIILVAVAAMGLHRELLGQKISYPLLDYIYQKANSDQISITGEGGEYESFVLDTPFFPYRLNVEDAITHWDESREVGYYEILKVSFASKEGI